jgi:hypothetical protein
VAGVAAQRPDELAGGGVALLQAAGDAQQVVVVLLDQSRLTRSSVGTLYRRKISQWPSQSCQEFFHVPL